MNLRFVVGLLSIITTVISFHAVPVLFASHKLVKDIRSSKELTESHSAEEVTNLAKKLITQCSSNQYILVNIPGLRLEDLRVSEKDNWPFLRKYLTMSSTVLGVPWCEDPIDLNYLEKYIIKTCKAETINVIHEDDEEVNEYIDTRVRVIKVELSELSGDSLAREGQIRRYDDLIRKILRKLPSPHYSIIMTSSKVVENHFTPHHIIEGHPERFQIFNDIFNDPSREFDVERNDRFHEVPPVFSAPRHTNDRYLANKKKDEIHFFDYELWKKNEQLIMTIVVMVLGIAFLKVTSIMKYVLGNFSRTGGDKKRD
ncbi:protein Big1p [[Candida] railenensis]|uniref:Protein BIG1 n=1 Tax=[Candida] railenensis TaxID=45579 RepID=A0A9P0QPD2_9ASCO|nr:protein Big1p [[Candida] railenensis]